jgi:glutamine amidotransferase
MIAIVDYGMGNLRSVAKALERVGARVAVTHSAETIGNADGVVLPGVGAFGKCMDNLRDAGLEECVREVANSNTPFLGICVGMQILFDESEEFGPVKGLGILPGKVKRFEQCLPGMKIPHMGWNQLEITARSRAPQLRGVPDGASVYFVHSYYVEADVGMLAASTTTYGGSFISSVLSENIFATQFHPEKSQALGLKLLANFASIAGESVF